MTISMTRIKKFLLTSSLKKNSKKILKNKRRINFSFKPPEKCVVA